MTDLGRLSIADIERKVKCFGNLFYHRTVILERIRKIAFRNMIHISKAIEDCNDIENSVQNYIPPLEHTQAKMLSDQGLENNRVNRTIIGWSTYYSLHVYLALLYAEIEFYENAKKEYNIFTDADLDSYLGTNREVIDSLGKFRDGLLHPSDTSTSAELNFLNTGNSYNIAPILQGKFDACLGRLRQKLCNSMFNVINHLPEIQKNYCFARFLEINVERMKNHQDLEGIQQCTDNMKDLIERQRNVLGRTQGWVPDHLQQEKIACRIAQCLNILNPSRFEIRFTQLTPPGTVQTPMQLPIANMLASGKQDLNLLGSGNYATYIRDHVGFHMRLIITGIVLFNEMLYDKENAISLSILQQYPVPTEAALDEFSKNLENIVNNDNFGLQELDEYSAPARVTMALFYELLRVYKGLTKENPLVTNNKTNSKLDSILSRGRLKNLELHRHSVFHIANPQRDSAEVDLMFTTSGDVGIFEDILVGILDFWGISSDLFNTS